MVAATPGTLGDVLGQIIDEASREAALQSDRLRQILDDAEQQPGQLLDALKQAVDPPDWWNLLLFVTVRLTDLADGSGKHLTVGVAQPPGWSRMVTLTYHVDADVAFTFGLAIADKNTTHGVMLAATAPVSASLGDDRLHVTLGANAASTWLIPFGGPLPPPDKAVKVTVRLSVDPKIDLGDATAALAVGEAFVEASLAYEPIDWTVTIGAGDAARPGVRAGIDVGSLLGALGSFVSIAKVDQQYSPHLVLHAGAGPKFDLGQRDG